MEKSQASASKSMSMTNKDETVSFPLSPPVHLDILESLKSQREETPDGSLYQDAQIVSFIHHFTQHIQRRSGEVSDRILHFTEKAHDLEYEISKKKLEFYLCSNRKYVENTIIVPNSSQRPPPSHTNNNNHTNDTTTTNNILSISSSNDGNADIKVLDNMEQLEDLAITDGMKALSIFHDPEEEIDDQYFQMEEEDSCYYYESNVNDQFNQRPLPYIIGTPEFFESDDVGLGPEVLNNNANNTITANETTTTTNHTDNNLDTNDVQNTSSLYANDSYAVHSIL